MSDKIQVRIKFSGEAKATGYIQEPQDRSIRKLLSEGGFLELEDKHGETVEWVNIDQIASLRIHHGDTNPAVRVL